MHIMLANFGTIVGVLFFGGCGVFLISCIRAWTRESRALKRGVQVETFTVTSQEWNLLVWRDGTGHGWTRLKMALFPPDGDIRKEPAYTMEVTYYRSLGELPVGWEPFLEWMAKHPNREFEWYGMPGHDLIRTAAFTAQISGDTAAPSVFAWSQKVRFEATGSGYPNLLVYRVKPILSELVVQST